MTDPNQTQSEDQTTETTQEIPKGQEGKQVADLNKLQEKSNVQDNMAIDTSIIKVAMEKLALRTKEFKRQQQEKKEQLSKVNIKKEDCETIMDEFNLPKDKAERILRENDGDLLKVMEILVNGD